MGGAAFAYRIIGFTAFVCMGIFNLTVRPRVELSRKGMKHIPFMNLLKQKAFIVSDDY